MKSRLYKITFIGALFLLIMPSLIYLIQKKTIIGFNTYYNFFLTENADKIISSVAYLVLFLIISILYIFFIRNGKFKTIKETLIYIIGASVIFILMIPWTSSDVFYYMGVGELNSQYGQNPYYISIRKYCNDNKEKVNDDEIMQQAYINYWANTTVIYGPVAQILFTIITKLSFKNIVLCLLLFKIINAIVHILNCYLIYKITKKIKFVVIYGLNPFILLEFIGMCHNDIIVVFFILLSLYYLIKRKQILPSIIFLSLATGIKYFTILLLPVVILYHFRKEKSLLVRFMKCIQYGIVFLTVLCIGYAIYFKDFNIFTAALVQNEKYSKSIYSGIIGLKELIKIDSICIFNKVVNLSILSKYIKNSVLVLLAITYIKFCIDLFTAKNIKFYRIIQKYNLELLIFIFALATFQQWYIIWIFATIMWQKSNMVKYIIVFSIATEIANSVYMFNFEHYKYDILFWIIIAITILPFFTQRLLSKNIEKIAIRN